MYMHIYLTAIILQLMYAYMYKWLFDISWHFSTPLQCYKNHTYSYICCHQYCKLIQSFVISTKVCLYFNHNQRHIDSLLWLFLLCRIPQQNLPCTRGFRSFHNITAIFIVVCSAFHCYYYFYFYYYYYYTQTCCFLRCQSLVVR